MNQVDIQKSARPVVVPERRRMSRSQVPFRIGELPSKRKNRTCFPRAVVVSAFRTKNCPSVVLWVALCAPGAIQPVVNPFGEVILASKDAVRSCHISISTNSDCGDGMLEGTESWVVDVPEATAMSAEACKSLGVVPERSVEA